MQKLLVEISHQDQIYVEDECTKHGYTISGFFEKLLNDYRSSVNERYVVRLSDTEQETPESEEKETEIPPEPKKRGRKKKTD